MTHGSFCVKMLSLILRIFLQVFFNPGMQLCYCNNVPFYFLYDA
jgi:hypothetical protein